MNDTRFEHCIKCTVCTTACPVSRVNPRYPGPKQAPFAPPPARLAGLIRAIPGQNRPGRTANACA